jgi:chemotaxis protein MotB
MMSKSSFRERVWVLTLFPALLFSGCVKKSSHQQVLDQFAQARADHETLASGLREQLEARDGEISELRAAAESEASRRNAREAELNQEIADAREQRSRIEGYFEEARTEVHRLEVLLSERGEDFRRLQSRLNSMAAVEREQRERNRIYEEVLARFRTLIDGGRLTVSIVNGRMVIHLPQDILFESGSANLSRDGRQTLGEVAGVLAELTDRRFQVEGHTDNVPISTARFPSNWELSAARSLSVVHLLTEQGVSPENLSGAGYGEHQPVASNENPENRRRNRRIEIVMLPNLNLIASTPEGG